MAKVLQKSRESTLSQYMLQLNSQTQTLSSMCAEPSARSHTPQHNVQLTSEFTCAHETTVNSQTPFAGNFRFSLFFAAPAFSSSRAQMHKTKSTLWPRDEREPSAVHTVSKYVRVRASNIVPCFDDCSRRMKPNAKEATGPATAAREAGPAAACTLTLQSTAAAVDVDHVLKLSTGRQKKSQVR